MKLAYYVFLVAFCLTAFCVNTSYATDLTSPTPTPVFLVTAPPPPTSTPTVSCGMGTSDIDCDGLPSSTDPDDDGDGIADANDPDVDGDGIANGADGNIDGDGLANTIDPDMDGDGVANGSDSDMDGDGYSNGQDMDTDGDGVGNTLDSDIDGDGIANGQDTDIDSDDVSNWNDSDMDADGVANGSDDNINADGVNNWRDSDMDGDGINDYDDLDANSDNETDSYIRIGAKKNIGFLHFPGHVWIEVYSYNSNIYVEYPDGTIDYVNGQQRGWYPENDALFLLDTGEWRNNTNYPDTHVIKKVKSNRIDVAWGLIYMSDHISDGRNYSMLGHNCVETGEQIFENVWKEGIPDSELTAYWSGGIVKLPIRMYDYLVANVP